MKRIPLSQGKYVIVDDADFEWLNQWAWHYGAAGTAVRNHGKGKILMHRVITDAASGLVVDHINRDRLDNRRSNLRVVTQHVNMLNRKLPSHNTTGYRGVYICRNKKSWVAAIVLSGHNKHLGVFYTKLKAAEAYNIAALKYHGEFAQLNKLI